MDRMVTALKLGAAGIAALWVSVPLAIKLMLAMMAFDIVSGVLKAIRSGTYTSAIGREGVVRKAQAIVLVLAVLVMEAAVVQMTGGERLGWDVELAGRSIHLTIASAAATMAAFHELGSIIENADEAGVPWARIVRERVFGVRPASQEG